MGAGERLWLELRPVLWFFVALLGTSAAALVYLRLGGGASPGLLLVETVADAVIVLAFVATEWRSVGPALARFGFRGPDALLPGLVLLGLALFFAVYFRGVDLLGLDEPELIPLFREHGWSLVWAFVLVSAAPAVFEELGFRGFVQGRLERILGPTAALLTQAALFSVIHLSVFILVSHFVMGVALGFLRRRTGSLYPGMIVHAAWNAGVLMLELV